MKTGTYNEPLPCGGKLKVTETSWEISYDFSGPNTRYHRAFVTVPGQSVEEYICAFNENWMEFQALKESIPKECQFMKGGKMGMSIHIGSLVQGVCIQSHHMPISSEEQLEKIIAGYRYAAQRAPKIQRFLTAL
jgi:Fe-S-cluster containining protein